MPTANIYNMEGEVVGHHGLDPYVFGATVNTAVLHQVVTIQLLNRRQGNASTKRRGEVSGGNKKPYRHKGTGRARQGSTRAPHFRGGGTVFGPHPHPYEATAPRKMRRLAIRSALSDKAANGQLLLVQDLHFEAPSTREMKAFIDLLPIERNVLLLMPERDKNVILSARNLHEVKMGHVASINVVELLKYEYLMMPVATVDRIVEVFGREADLAFDGKRHPRLLARRLASFAAGRAGSAGGQAGAAVKTAEPAAPAKRAKAAAATEPSAATASISTAPAAPAGAGKATGSAQPTTPATAASTPPAPATPPATDLAPRGERARDRKEQE
jgi:large subunit ribosomal protein L4